jgi:hypothetical protein
MSAKVSRDNQLLRIHVNDCDVGWLEEYLPDEDLGELCFRDEDGSYLMTPGPDGGVGFSLKVEPPECIMPDPVVERRLRLAYIPAGLLCFTGIGLLAPLCVWYARKQYTAKIAQRNAERFTQWARGMIAKAYINNTIGLSVNARYVEMIDETNVEMYRFGALHKELADRYNHLAKTAGNSVVDKHVRGFPTASIMGSNMLH